MLRKAQTRVSQKREMGWRTESEKEKAGVKAKKTKKIKKEEEKSELDIERE